MTTAAVFDGALAGALAALCENRTFTANTPVTAPATTNAAAANAFATQFLTANTALTTPMADASTNIALLCFAASFGELSGRQYVSAVATDYALLATNAVANAKAAAGFLE
jgi:hypothetical protein